jgi:hypothetical protein
MREPQTMEILMHAESTTTIQSAIRTIPGEIGQPNSSLGFGAGAEFDFAVLEFDGVLDLLTAMLALDLVGFLFHE